MKEYDLYVMDKDTCPEMYDTIIYRGQCTGCEHYKGFEMYNGQPCVQCDYYVNLGNNN